MTPEAEQRSHELETLKCEATCAVCLRKLPTKRHLGIDYCVDDFPEAAGE
jgi:hypothetical protein